MNWLNLSGIAIGLAMDAFAVSIAAGLILDRVTPHHIFRLAFHFGLFQAPMPILGWMAGTEIAAHFSTYDHWVAFGLLAAVGGKMLLDATKEAKDRSQSDPTRGWTLLVLSIATSIDALAVGMGMAFMRVSIWTPAVVIGVVAAALSGIGITFGGRFGPHAGRWAEAGGGCVLIAIGARIVITHMAG